MKITRITLLTALLLSPLAALHAADKPPQPAKAETVSAQSEKPDLAAIASDAQTEHFRNNRQSLAHDPYRPLYHFSSATTKARNIILAHPIWKKDVSRSINAN